MLAHYEMQGFDSSLVSFYDMKIMTLFSLGLQCSLVSKFAK